MDPMKINLILCKFIKKAKKSLNSNSFTSKSNENPLFLLGAARLFSLKTYTFLIEFN